MNDKDLDIFDTDTKPKKGDIKIIKFIEIWEKYPNGDMYFKQKFPIGEEKKRLSAAGKARKGPKKSIKQTTIGKPEVH